MHPPKVYYLGTKEIGLECLQILMPMHTNNKIEIVGVLTNNRSISKQGLTSVREYADQNGLTIYESLKDIEDLPPVDFLISVQYHKILKQQHINLATILAVNLHLAPLPEYRGCNQFSFAIADKCEEFGTTLHRLESGIDSGAIIYEKRFKMQDGIFVSELYNQTYKASVDLFRDKIASIFSGDYNLIPQADLQGERSESIHYRKEIETLKEISASWPPEKKKRIFRATYFPPFPNPILVDNDQRSEVDLDWYNSLG